ncbi:MAG: sugar transporter [Myxococcaceae bacterium]|nr:sugar transporter [Myxococcaceae bacterium]
MSQPTPAKLDAPSNARLLARLLLVAWDHAGRCSLALAAQLLLLALSVMALGWTGTALDVVHRQLDPSAATPRWPWGLVPPLELSAWSQVMLIAGTIAALALLRTLLSFVYGVTVADLVHGQIVPSIRARVYEKLQSLSFRFYDQHPSGSLINRVTSDVQYLRSFVDGVLIQGVVMLLALLVYGGYMFSMHAGLTLVCLASTPLLWILTMRFSRRVLPAHAHSRKQMDQLVHALSEAIQGIQVIKGFARETHFLERLAERNLAVRDGQEAIFKHVSRFTPTIDLLTLGNVTALLCYGGVLVVNGSLTVGELVVFATLLQQFSTQVSTMSTIMNTLQESLIGARRVFEVLDTESEVKTPEQPTTLPEFVGNLRFEQVSFAYHEGTPVLHELDFEVRSGEHVALFGPAGSGKTSLLGLIPRFYDVTSGKVSIDGVDVRELALHELRTHTALVFQETFLFSNTVAANIAFGHPEATRAQVEHAARQASAHEFIEQLPQGYDTVLGELATNLSGGQRQRIAIARALLGEPRILLLDDPTAALDAETTEEILGSLRSAARGRTTLFSTHRPQLLKSADRVLVLEQGRIVQAGSHDELLRNDGPYRRALAPDDLARRPARELDASARLSVGAHELEARGASREQTELG